MLLLATLLPSSATALTVAHPHVTVSLVAEAQSIEPGRPLMLGLHFAPEHEWHVYWKNPGDSGEAPSVRWTLPAGFAAGALQWPLPRRIRIGPIVNHVYDEVLLPVEIRTPAGLATGSEIEIGATVAWLLCRVEECIPGEAHMTLRIPVSPGTAASDPAWHAEFIAARAALPEPARAHVHDAGDGYVRLRVRAPRHASPDARFGFYPTEGGAIDLGASQDATIDGSYIEVRLAKSELAPPHVSALDGLLVVENGEVRSALEVHAIAEAASHAWAALLFAFAGGLLLNLMPCVFPVLSLKILGFVQQAREDPRHIRAHGWTFTAGVLVSFWVLAGAMLAIRAAGEQIGWGFQLQSPGFLMLLAAVLFVFGLSLCGVFEVGLLLTRVGERSGGSVGYAGSFTTGALATVVATPCTAPLMGPALGYALTQPPATAMAVFTALGAGMASPYLVLSYFPRALARLPRPGAWMESFRQLMAFPLFATVLWLLHVLRLQAGEPVLMPALSGLLLLALAAWMWGKLQSRGERSPLLASVCAAVAVAGITVALAAARQPQSVSAAALPQAAAGAFWEPWSPARERELRALGKPLFVNFTAAWCISCQVNEQMVFASEDVRTLFRRHGVTPLKADWTNKDEDIARALAAFGRDGVPLYVFYSGRPGTEPEVLPQIPTKQSLLDAFQS